MVNGQREKSGSKILPSNPFPFLFFSSALPHIAMLHLRLAPRESAAPNEIHRAAPFCTFFFGWERVTFAS